MPPMNEVLEWRGQTMVGSGGDKIGKIEEIYLDAETRAARVGARPRPACSARQSSFVPIADATTQRRRRRQVPFEKAQVKDAPKLEADGELSQQRRVGAVLALRHRLRRVALRQRAARGRRPTATTTATTSGTVGHDVSGRETDDAMTRSEEELRVGTAQRETGRARLRKYVVTENVTQTVPVQREEVRVEREPITDANRDAATVRRRASPRRSTRSCSTRRRSSSTSSAVPKERVRLDKDTVTERAAGLRESARSRSSDRRRRRARRGPRRRPRHRRRRPLVASSSLECGPATDGRPAHRHTLPLPTPRSFTMSTLAAVKIGDSLQQGLDSFFGFLPNLHRVPGHPRRSATSSPRSSRGSSSSCSRRPASTRPCTPATAGRYVEKARARRQSVEADRRGRVLVHLPVRALDRGRRAEDPRAHHVHRTTSLAYLPNVIAAVLIFVIAGVVAAAIGGLVARTMGDTPTGKLVGSVVPAAGHGDRDVHDPQPAPDRPGDRDDHLRRADRRLVPRHGARLRPRRPRGRRPDVSATPTTRAASTPARSSTTCGPARSAPRTRPSTPRPRPRTAATPTAARHRLASA